MHASLKQECLCNHGNLNRPKSWEDNSSLLTKLCCVRQGGSYMNSLCIQMDHILQNNIETKELAQLQEKGCSIYRAQQSTKTKTKTSHSDKISLFWSPWDLAEFSSIMCRKLLKFQHVSWMAARFRSLPRSMPTNRANSWQQTGLVPGLTSVWQTLHWRQCIIIMMYHISVSHIRSDSEKLVNNEQLPWSFRHGSTSVRSRIDIDIDTHI